MNMIKYFVPILLCISVPSFAASEFDKDVGYCSGLTASMAAVNPDEPSTQNAIVQLTELVKNNAETMDVEDSRKTAEAYALVLQKLRSNAPDIQSENIAIVVDMGLKSCKKIGVQVLDK